MSPELKTRIAPVLGRIPSGVFILVAGDGDGRMTGMLASWIQQAAFEPPQITVAVNKTRYLVDWLRPGVPVTINQISKGENTLFRHFAKGFDRDADAFAGVDLTHGIGGLPVLRAAMASLEGTISDQMHSADHVIFLVTVTNAIAHNDPDQFDPFVHLRKNGFNY